MARSRQELEQRLAEINDKIIKATSWGAMLTALSEERNGIEAEIRRLDAGRSSIT